MDELLAEVLRSPEDSTARVVHADRLQAAGDPRGELISISCLLADLADDDPGRPALARRELALIRERLPAWAAELGLAKADIAIVRGFPDRIDNHEVRPELCDQIPLTTLTLRGVKLAKCQELCASMATPTLRDLTIIEARSKDLEPMVAALANAAWLSQVRALRLLGVPVNDADLVALVTSARLEHLDTLKVEGLFNEVKVTRKGLAAALAAPEFRRLRELALNKVSLKVPGARCFATASHAATLERLRLSDCKLGSDGTRLVLESEALPALTNLSLRDNMLGEGEPVSVGPALARTLRRLELSLNGLDDAWAAAFVAARPLAITHLGLRSNRLSIAGVRMLIEADTLPALESLSVAAPRDDVPKWGRDLESLVELPGFARIRVLDAYMTDVTSAGTIALARSPHVRQLRHLKLSFNAIGPSGVDALATSEQLGNLECLELDNTGLGDDGIERLCASERLQKLRYLDLSGNTIGERGYAALSRTKAFPMLRVLRLYEAKGARRVALEQHLGAIVDVGEFTGSMGRWLPDDFDM